MRALWAAGGAGFKSEMSEDCVLVVPFRGGFRYPRRDVLIRRCMMTDPVVLSPYQSNVDPVLLGKQREVFAHLKIPLEQVNTDGIEHGAWMEEAARNPKSDVIMFCDIDAFPVHRSAYEKVVAQARAGHLVGAAHVANHFDPEHIYAGPMFLAVTPQVYQALGRTGFARKDGNDAAQYLTRSAEAAGIPIDLLYPSTVVDPRWPMAGRGVYGIGTFYAENGIFHLFEARYAENIDLFSRVADDVMKGQLDFASYLEMRRPPKPVPPVKAFLKSLEKRLKPFVKPLRRS